MQIEEKEYDQSFDWRIWKKLFPFMKPFRKYMIIALVFNTLCALVDIALPLFQQYAINHFISGNTTKEIGSFAGTYLVTIIFQTVSVVIFCRCAMVIEMNMAKNMKKACFDHLQQLSFSYYNTTPVGYILARVMNDTGRISGLIAWNLLDMMWAMFYVVGIFGIMLALNWKLALWIMLIVPGLVLLTSFFQKRILKWNRQVRKKNSMITGAYNEGITGAQTSKALVIEEKNSRHFRGLTDDMKTAGVKAARMNGLYVALVVFCGYIGVALALKQGGELVLAQALQLGTLSAFTTYAVNMFEPIRNIASNLSEIVAAQANIERVTGLLEEEPQIKDRPDVIEKYGTAFEQKRENWEPIKGDITFEDVTFHYPDGNENILEHFNLHVPAGTTVAIVGETGAGKSTLVNLACRFFEPTQGRILIDGVDYRERSQSWLHSALGYVLQSPHLFTGTIMENIRYGRLDATDEEVIAAAKAAHAHHFIMSQPGGYQMELNEETSNISQGQKQLLTIARAILADNKIMILDEATSSVDTRTEERIQKAMDNLMKGRTSFVIAHRLSTIRDADLILVMKDGDIIEQGTHESLLAKNGFYANLYNSQFEKMETV